MSYRSAGDNLLNGESSILGAMLIMGIGSFVLTLLLWWIPIIGVFIGPVVAGFIGGRRAGTVGRAMLAAILPCLALTAALIAGGAILGHALHSFAVGALAALAGGVVGIVALVHSGLLIAAALAGGISRQVESM